MINVLLVDDEPLVRAFVQGLTDWSRKGFDLSGEARNGIEAMEQLNKGDFDIVLLDMSMPRCDGICFLKKLQSSDKNPAVIVISAFDEFALVREAFTLGALDYLLKSDICAVKVLEVLRKAAVRRKLQIPAGKQRAGEQLRQQILKDLLFSRRPKDFLPILDGLGLKLKYPCLLIQFRFRNRNDTIWQYLRGGLESCSDGLFVKLSDTDMIWILFPDEQSALSLPKQADGLCRELAELTRQSFNTEPEWAVGAGASGIEDFPKRIKELAQLFRNTSRPVHRAKSFIKKNFRDPELNLASAARYAGVSRTHLSALFTRELGAGFSDYLIQVRMEAAKKLLSESNQKVYEVAETVGYGSVEQFSRMFRRITGMTPNRYRDSSQS